MSGCREVEAITVLDAFPSYRPEGAEDLDVFSSYHPEGAEDLDAFSSYCPEGAEDAVNVLSYLTIKRFKSESDWENGQYFINGFWYWYGFLVILFGEV